MKRIFSFISAVVCAAAFFTVNMDRVFASVYNDDPPLLNDGYCYCILRFAEQPLAKYDNAKKYGVDRFIFTDEGQTAYKSIIQSHDNAYSLLTGLLGRAPERCYDYTSAYNGFSVVLSYSECDKVYENLRDLGIDSIYQLDKYEDEPESQYYSDNTSKALYSDITDNILERTGVSKVGYNGDSTVIAIIDAKFDAEHEFISTLPENVQGRLDAEFIDSVSPYLSATSGKGSGYYMNEKIPFKFSYENHNTDTSGTDAEYHGTHVAGIAVGNGEAETSEEYDPKGVAPEAQLLLMSSSLKHIELIAAYDDCAYLGADVVNASYGSAFSQVDDDPCALEAITNLTEAGIMFCSAAGNSGRLKFDSDSFTNLDYSSSGTPGSISSVLSVGSADNAVLYKNYITVGGENYVINQGSRSIVNDFGGKEMDMVLVPGLGYPEDFEGLDLNGKIAVIVRGEIEFDEKAANAKEKGAVGVIFCNNDPNDGYSTSVSCNVLPCCMISFEDALRLIESDAEKVKINKEQQAVTSLNDKMNGYSTWGFTKDLVLKPDITAYGGSIVSSSPGGNYILASGTSMATPQISGMTALLKEYLKENKERYGIESESDYPELMAKLLMSTAKPVYDYNGTAPASPRVQGSGLANIEAAINTPAYIYTTSEKDNFRPKLSLGDNLDQNMGTIEFSLDKFCFVIKNVSDKDITYKLSADLLRDDITIRDYKYVLSDFAAPMTKSKVVFKQMTEKISEITVEAGGEAIVNLDIDMDIDDRNYIAEAFPDGTFIDGFVYLTSDSAPQLSIPFSGYYGSWSDLKIFEPFIYDTRENPSIISSVMGDSNENAAGINIIEGNYGGGMITYMPAYSPNGDNVFDNICLYLAFKRRCENINVSVYKKDECVYEEEIPLDCGYQTNDMIYIQYNMTWPFTDVKDGEIYEVLISAETPYIDSKGRKEYIDQEFIIDLSAPEIEDCRELDINGEEFILIKATDNQAIQGMVINDGYDYNVCAKDNPVTHYGVLKLPEDKSDISVEVYDRAGNYKTVTAKDMSADKYTLNFNDVIYASTAETSFKKKIAITDSSGKSVGCAYSTTPSDAYKKGINEVTVYMSNSEIVTIPISVGLAGDADSNGAVDLYDAIRIAKYILYKSNPKVSFKSEFKGFEGSLEECLADYDANGNIDLYDVIGVAKYLLTQSK